MSKVKRIVVLGASGSIGSSTLRVIRAHPDKLKLVGISCHSNVKRLIEIANEFDVPNLCLSNEAALNEYSEPRDALEKRNFCAGASGLETLASLPEVDIVLVATVGTAALKPTLCALEHKHHVAIANKEILVMAGEFVMKSARRNNVRLLPVDSEHNAIFQCLEAMEPNHVENIVLTASGGPFLRSSLSELKAVTLDQALKHPNWSMGPKITIDSASMANKGLELIEAHWLFGMPSSKIEVVIHPQSIIHSMVRAIDGSVIAQLSPPLMTFAIQHALFYPDRHPPTDQGMDFSKPISMDLEPVDNEKFPCLNLARSAIDQGGGMPAVFNAANEIAVEAFIKGKIGFIQIAEVIDQTLGKINIPTVDVLEDVLIADKEARRVASVLVQS